MFAGSCIGVICLVVALEFLRRLGRDYDRHLKRQSTNGRLPQQANQDDSSSDIQPLASGSKGVHNANREIFNTRTRERQRAFSPSVLQQAARAAIHMIQFGVAYFIMLLAMYYNGKLTSFRSMALLKATMSIDSSRRVLHHLHHHWRLPRIFRLQLGSGNLQVGSPLPPAQCPANICL